MELIDPTPPSSGKNAVWTFVVKQKPILSSELNSELNSIALMN